MELAALQVNQDEKWKQVGLEPLKFCAIQYYRYLDKAWKLWHVQDI